MPADAPWSILHQQWHGNGLLVADPEAYPHLLMSGTSGNGKTRFGWQVAVYNRSGLDFLPFQQHPNAHTVLLEDPTRTIDRFALLCEIL